jgi:hypothetical protein
MADRAPEPTGNTKEEVVQWATAWLEAFGIPVSSTAPEPRSPVPPRRAPDWRENAERAISWLTEASCQAADSDRPESAGMLYLASELLGEIRQEEDDRAPVQPVSSFDRAPAPEDCREFADQGPVCWAWSDDTRTWGLMGQWALWGAPRTLWVPWWAIDLPDGWGEEVQS